MNRFGEKLRALRKKQGLTLEQLGNILDVHNTYVSQMEKGKSTPNAAMILKIARFFNVATDQLMKDELDLDMGADEPPTDKPKCQGKRTD